MSSLAVAEKDFHDAIQSRALWALTVVFLLLSSLISYAYVEAPEAVVAGGGEAAGGTAEATLGGLIFFTAGTVALFVTLTAIVVSYKSIAGEREIGSVKLLLALPHTRRDVLLGKLLGRTAVLSVAVAIGLLVGFGLGSLLLGTVEAVPILLFLLVTLLFSAVFTSIVVSISATTGSTSRATTLAVGFFLLFELLWGAIPTAIVYVANGFSMPEQLPDWVFLVMQVPPSAAYVSALTAVLPEMVESAPTQSVAGADFDAFYATPEIGFVVLAFWLLVPPAIGYYRFDRADL